MRISELIDDSAVLTVPLDRGQVQVQFRPRVLVPSWQRKIRDGETNGDDEAAFYAPIKSAAISWDLEGDDGAPIPLTSEAMAEVPRQILSSVVLGLVAASRPNQQRVLDNFTVGSSAPGDGKTPSRNGPK
jgi:hypothetical protein